MWRVVLSGFWLAACQASIVTGDLGVSRDKPGGADRAVSDTRLDVSRADQAPAVWRPRPGLSWQWQLLGTIDTSVDAAVYDIDLFDAPAATITALRAQQRMVICYFSAGSFESWRADAAAFPEAAKGKEVSGWNERWLDIRSQAVRQIMLARLDLAVAKGCHAVEPDNVDGFRHDTGFALSAADQIAYAQFLSAEAHARRLSVGLKNNLSQVKELEPLFDWALNESCMQFKECGTLSPFIAAGKAVFHVEYAPATPATVCPTTKALKLDTIIKKATLDAWREVCN